MRESSMHELERRLSPSLLLLYRLALCPPRAPTWRPHRSAKAMPKGCPRYAPLCRITVRTTQCMRNGLAANCTSGGMHVTQSGAWKVQPEYVYYIDRGLLAALLFLFGRNSSVVEIGAGLGCYTSALQASGQLSSLAAYDGINGIGKMTRGLVEHADLTSQMSASPAEWVLVLEVMEHIPVAAEQMALRNIAGIAAKGVVLSWSNSAAGMGHVNLRNQSEVVDKMAAHGYAHDAVAQSRLRRAVSNVGWYRETLMVFLRPAPPPAGAPPEVHLSPELDQAYSQGPGATPRPVGSRQWISAAQAFYRDGLSWPQPCDATEHADAVLQGIVGSSRQRFNISAGEWDRLAIAAGRANHNTPRALTSL